MPVPKIVAKAIVGSIKGKKAGEAAATAAAKKAAAAKAAAANARGLKAAQGPSMAPKGYTADDARRAAMAAARELSPSGVVPREFVNELAKLQKIMLQSAPVNVVSKSGKKVIKPKAK
jgi:hypothetical protein